MQERRWGIRPGALAGWPTMMRSCTSRQAPRRTMRTRLNIGAAVWCVLLFVGETPPRLTASSGIAATHRPVASCLAWRPGPAAAPTARACMIMGTTVLRVRGGIDRLQDLSEVDDILDNLDEQVAPAALPAPGTACTGEHRGDGAEGRVPPDAQRPGRTPARSGACGRACKTKWTASRRRWRSSTRGSRRGWSRRPRTARRSGA